MAKIKFKIATPERVVLEKEVDQITVPTEAGEITILPNHIPLVSNAVAGVVEYKMNGNGAPMAISGGFLEFHDNELTILADTAERAEEIDMERAEAARKRAQEMVQERRKTLDENEYASVISGIEKQLVRIKVAKRYHSRTSRGVRLEN